MLLKLAQLSGKQHIQLLQLKYMKHNIQADTTRGYSALSVGDGDDVLSLAEGKA